MEEKDRDMLKPVQAKAKLRPYFAFLKREKIRKCYVDLISKTPIGVGEARNGVYYLKKSVGGKALTATQHEDCVLWYQRLGHPPFGSLSHLSGNFGFKLNKNFDECYDVCHCAK